MKRNILGIVLAMPYILQAKLIDFTIKNNLKVPVEYGPIGNRSTAINADLLGGPKRTLKANTGTFTSNGGTATESIDSDQFPRFLFRVQGDPKLYLYEFNAQPYNKIEVAIEKGPSIKPASVLTGIKSKDIKEVAYAAPETASRPEKKPAPEAAQPMKQPVEDKPIPSPVVPPAEKSRLILLGLEDLVPQPAPQAPKAPKAKTPNQNLFDAVKNGDGMAVQDALKQDASANAKGEDFATPLITAINYLNRDASKIAQKDAIIAALINAKADVNVKAGSGATALMAASYFGDLATMQALIKAGAKLDEQNKKGITALMMAAEAGQKDAVKALIDAGANVTRKSSDARAAINYAKDPVIKNMLLKAEPKPAVKPAIPQAPSLGPSAQQAIPQAPPMGPVSGSVAAVPPAPAAPSMAPAPARPSTPVQSQSPDLLKEIQAGKGLRKVSDQEKQQTRKSELEKGLAKQRAAIAGDEDDEEEVVDKEAMAKEEAAIDKLAIEIYTKFSQEYKGRITKDIAQTIAKKLSRQGDQNLNNARVQTWVKKEIAELAPLQGGQAGGIGLGGIKVPEYLKKAAQESEEWD